MIRGVEKVPCSRLPLTIKSFRARSAVESAETLSQKESSSRTASVRSPFKRAYQTRRAQIAPPEVPLRATISYRSSFSTRSRLSTRP